MQVHRPAVLGRSDSSPVIRTPTSSRSIRWVGCGPTAVVAAGRMYQETEATQLAHSLDVGRNQILYVQASREHLCLFQHKLMIGHDDLAIGQTDPLNPSD